MLRKTVIARALTLAFATGAVGVAVMEPAMAQSNASGNIYGQVDSPAGATIVVHNKETGQKRSISPEANGRYQFTALPVGTYKVELVRDGKVVNTSEVQVNIGQGTDASFTATSIAKVQITGTRSRIDVSNTNSGIDHPAGTEHHARRLPLRRQQRAFLRRLRGIRERVLHQRFPNHQRAVPGRFLRTAIRLDRPGTGADRRFRC